MPAVFLVSDTHFGHRGMCTFTRADGVTKLRPWDTPEEMDEAMVKSWNERVGPTPSDTAKEKGERGLSRRDQMPAWDSVTHIFLPKETFFAKRHI